MPTFNTNATSSGMYPNTSSVTDLDTVTFQIQPSEGDLKFNQTTQTIDCFSYGVWTPVPIDLAQTANTRIDEITATIDALSCAINTAMTAIDQYKIKEIPTEYSEYKDLVTAREQVVALMNMAKTANLIYNSMLDKAKSKQEIHDTILNSTESNVKD